MIAGRISFVEAVRLLDKHLPSRDDSAEPVRQSGVDSVTNTPVTLRTHREKNFVAIGDILAPLSKQVQPKRQKQTPLPPTPNPTDELTRLEKRIEVLSHELKNLKTVIRQKK